MNTSFALGCGCLMQTSELTPAGPLRCGHGTRLECYGANRFDARPVERMQQLEKMNGAEIYEAMVQKCVGHAYQGAPAWVRRCSATSPTAHIQERLEEANLTPHSYLDVGSGTVGPSDYWYYNAMEMNHRITSDAFELRDDGGSDAAKWVFLLSFAQDLGGLLSEHRFDLIIVPETLEHVPEEEHTAVLDSVESLLSDKGLLCVTACNEAPHFHDEARRACATNPVGPFRGLPSFELLRDRGYDIFWNRGYQILAYKRRG